MSYVEKTYEFIEKLEALFNKKMFKVFFVAISSVFLFFGMMNTYAQENDVSMDDVASVSVSPNWQGIKAFMNVANNLENTGEDNMSTQGSLNLANTTYTAIAIIAPDVTAGSERIKTSPEIPEDMRGGLLGITNNAITYAYTNYPGVSITDHLAEEWVPGYKDSTSSTYAADGETLSGYDTLMNSGIAPLWSKIRNLAYVFFVIIMIVVGFMIMFRSKLGGQTLVSLGNTLPGIITALILITFSFAIAGLLIDLGGLITTLIASLYGGSDVVKGINSLGSLMGAALTGGTGLTAAISGPVGLGVVLPIAIKYGLVSAAAIANAPIIATIAAGLGIVMLIVALLIIGIVFVGGIKVLITLYKAFFGVLLGVVIGPIQIMMGAFPGKGYSTSNWFKSLLKNVLTFPMVFAIINLPSFLAAQGDINLSLPEKLSYSSNDGMNLNATGFLAMFIIRVIVLYFAAEAPKYLEAWFPSDTPKPVAEGLANAKASLSKVPLVGGLFK